MNMRVVSLASIALAAGSAFASGNLLNNAGFESPLGFDFSDLTNWNGFFGGPAGTYLEAFNTTGAAPRSGAQALVTTVRGLAGVTEGFNAFTGHVQFVGGIVPGQAYEMSVWARTNPAINTGAEYRIEWQTAAGVEVGRHNVEIQNQLTSAYQLFSFTEVAPPGAARAAVVLAVQSYLNDGVFANTSVAWDDASLTTVPAPAGCAIVGLGLLASSRRRRA